jgi:hypothetical protein
MNEPGDEIFPDAAFSCDKHFRCASSHACGRREEAFERDTTSDERRFSDDVCMYMHQR